MSGMKLQFPLIELLLCMTATAVLAGVIFAPIEDPGIVPGERQVAGYRGVQQPKTIKISQFHAPQRWEIIARLEWASPVIAGLALTAVMIVRHFRRSRAC